LWSGTSAQARPFVVFSASPGQLVVHSQAGGAVVAYHLPGDFIPETIALAGSFLQDIEANNNTRVVLEQVEGNRCRIRWDEAGVPREQSYDTVDPTSLPPIPAEPKQYTAPGDGFLNALHETAHSAARESARFALSHIQLRGQGTIVGTDGKQLLMWRGFRLPWQEDLLVLPCKIFSHGDLGLQEEVGVGRSNGHVAVKSGPWLVWLPINTEGRYPKAEDVLPRSSSATRFRLSSQDAAFLLRALPTLPAATDDSSPITIDVNQTITIRARSGNQDPGVEVLLAGSQAKGKPVRLCTDRQYLGRALALGLTEFQVVSPDAPLQAQDRARLYLWMPLSKEGALAPSDKDTHASSSAVSPSISNTPSTETGPLETIHTTQSRRRIDVRTPDNNGNGHADTSRPVPEASNGERVEGIDLLIEETLALHANLRDALARTTRLVQALKHHRKQNRLMRSALTSLRQLQQIAP
jgi:hypothetical protein